jgi:hypothetical protein
VAFHEFDIQLNGGIELPFRSVYADEHGELRPYGPDDRMHVGLVASVHIGYSAPLEVTGLQVVEPAEASIAHLTGFAPEQLFVSCSVNTDEPVKFKGPLLSATQSQFVARIPGKDAPNETTVLIEGVSRIK